MKNYAKDLYEFASKVPLMDTSNIKSLRKTYAKFVKLAPNIDLSDYNVTAQKLKVNNIFDGYQITITTFRPANNSDSLPVLVHFHGGGFILGDDTTDTQRCAQFSRDLKICVVNVDYRLAPEHKYPAAMLDGFSVLQWIQNNDSELNIDKERVGLSGVSAGGSIAASLAIYCRDKQLNWIKLQLLWYPALDNNMNAQSIQNGFDALVWNSQNVQDMWTHYLNKQGDNIYAVPAQVENFEKLPKTFIITCEFDPLKDGAQCFHNKLITAGIESVNICYEGTVHGFDTFTDLEISLISHAQCLEWLSTL